MSIDSTTNSAIGFTAHSAIGSTINSTTGSPDSNDQYNLLRQQIADSLRKAETQRGKLKRTDRRYSITHIVLSALAAVITGQSAAAGEAIIMDWKITTAIASMLGIGTTVVAGIQKQIVSPDLLEEASECVAKLRALRVEAITPTFDLEEVSEEYQQILAEFSKVDC